MAYKLVVALNVFLVAQTMINHYCFGKTDSASKVICLDAEKQALLRFKQDLVDPSSKLSTWVEEDDECCDWYGVVCDDVSGHVAELNLYDASLTGKINPSLLDLKHMSRLDLNNNDFEGTRIPSFLGSVSILTYLDLGYAGFEGMIPSQLGNLSNLEHLSISDFDFEESLSLYAENLDWVSGLSSLNYLHLAHVNLSRASDQWLFAINALPSLIELHLSGSELHRTARFPSPLNLTSIEVLDLSANALEIPLLCGVLANMSHLQSLDLSGNSFFTSSIPSCLYALPSLQWLNLGSCNLGGVISQEIGNQTSIETLDLSENSLRGKLPASMGNLCNLEELRLGGNQFGGEISEALESLSGCLSNRIMTLRLANCSFSGPIPVSLGALFNMVELDISSNHLQGAVSASHFTNLTNLEALYASGNSLSMRVGPDWTPPFQLEHIELSSWKLGPEFPMWLKSQNSIYHIELSNTGISGAIPDWFWNLSDSIDWLDLSHNQLSGSIPDLHGFDLLDAIDVHSNKLTGSIPRVHSNLEWLDLSNNSFSGDISGLVCNPMANATLTVLKLGDNMLAGNIPDCWMHWPSLKAIDLGNNNLSGEIPPSMGLVRDLASLHLHNNSLTGEIPKSLGNCSSLNGLNLGSNMLGGSVPTWIGSLSALSVLILRSNELRDHIPVEICALVELQILDFADNNLSGTIPDCLKNLFALTSNNNKIKIKGIYRDLLDDFLYFGFNNKVSREDAILVTKGRTNSYDKILELVTSLDLSSNNLSGEIPEELAWLQKLQHLNLSRNHLRGSIPRQIGNMTALESLDLSNNKLVGGIPPSMSILTFLDYLNLSYNNLSGEIPKSTQLQSLNQSSFVGNRLLCGDPLPKRCREDDHTRPVPKSGNGETEEGDGEEYWFRLGLVMGFGVGFSGIIAPLVLFGFWRRAYYWVVQEYIWYKISDCFIKFKHIVGITTRLHL